MGQVGNSQISIFRKKYKTKYNLLNFINCLFENIEVSEKKSFIFIDFGEDLFHVCREIINRNELLSGCILPEFTVASRPKVIR